MQSISSLFVAPSSLGGRGVFTTEDIKKGSIVEICPVIVLPETDRSHLDQTKLHDYYFIWGDADEQCAIILGFGSIYNHSYQPNAEYNPDFPGKTLSFYALEKIKAGSEITVNYNGTPSEQSDLWFTTKENPSTPS